MTTPLQTRRRPAQPGAAGPGPRRPGGPRNDVCDHRLDRRPDRLRPFPSQADRTGALHSISSTPVGGVLLWLLVIGFIGMTLWRLSEALYGAPGTSGRKPGQRLSALVRAIIYAVIAYGILKYTLGEGSPQSSDTQSVDLTATLLKHPGARRWW